MTRYVVDPPMLLGLVEKGQEPSPSHQLVAPNAIRSHVLELLYQRVRAGTLPERTALSLHERVTEVKLRLLGDRVSRRTAWDLATAHGWSSLDGAEYVAVASLQADALAASGPALRARAAGIVPLARRKDLLEP